MTDEFRFRWECVCGKHGRWYVNPNDADEDGERHMEKVDARGELSRHRLRVQERKVA